MSPGRTRKDMLIATIVMAALALALVILAYRKGDGLHVEGLRAAWATASPILPLLVLAFILAGMVQVLVPSEDLARWVGAESGLRGILIGTVAGGFTPGGPYVSLPIVAGFIRAGVGVGVVVAYVTAWSLWAVGRLPMEFGILGWRITLIRLAVTFFFPPIAGLLARVLFGRVDI